MGLRCESYSGQVPGNADETLGGSPTVSGGGTLLQVSVTLDRVSWRGGRSLDESRIYLQPGGGTRRSLPSIAEVRDSQSPDSAGTPRINVTANDRTSRTYGYYVVFDEPIDDTLDVIVENGDSRTANYSATVLYDQ